MATLFLRKSLGLGWVPDVPDHRDHTFKRTLTALHRRPRKAAAERAPGERQPSHGWKAISEDSLEKYLASDDSKDIVAKLDACKQVAFGTAQRQLLLPTPPDLLARVDLRPFMSPVRNQGPLDSCTTHAVIGLLEYLQIATRAAYVNGSRRFLYKVTRNLLQWNGDQGAHIRETMKALRLFGVCPERYFSYDVKRYDEEPSPFCYSFAANYQAVNYYRLENLDEIKQTLSQGYPVAFGFACYESSLARATAVSGVIPYPSKHERLVGGHSVLAVGYYEPGQHQRREEKSLEPEDQGYLIIRNSWGTSWGRGGYGFLPYRYIPGNEEGAQPLADDFWTMTQMKVPDWSDTSTAPFVLNLGRHEVLGPPRVTFIGARAVSQFSTMPVFGGGASVDDGDVGPWGAPVDGGDYGEPSDGGGGGQPTDGGGYGAGTG